MPISAGRPLLLPPYDCVYTPTTTVLAPEGPTNPAPIFAANGLNVPNSTIPHWSADIARRRALAFGPAASSGRLVQLNRKLPIVGNLRASMESMGLRGVTSTGDDFADVPRGARKHTTPSGEYIVWEPRNYFGKPRTMLRTPKAVLISADYRRLPVFNFDIPTGLIRINSDVADAIDLRYDDLIDAKGLTVVLDVSRGPSYNPYSYGVPLNPHDSPFASDPALDQFIGGELLTIHINPFDVELMADGRTPIYGLVTSGDLASYFCYFPNIAYFYSPAGAVLDQPADLINFADPAADGAAWTAAEGNYSRRRHIIHNAVFPASPYSSWLLREEVISGPAAYTYGPAPHGHGVNYIANTKPAGMLIGRPYQRESGGSFISTDFTAAIIEDIEDFYA